MGGMEQPTDTATAFMSDGRHGAAADEFRRPASAALHVPAVQPDGTFVKVQPDDHPLPRACEVSVYMQDYHRSSSKLGRFGKIVGIDEDAAEYLVMLDNFECVAVPMRRAEWRKLGT